MGGWRDDVRNDVQKYQKYFDFSFLRRCHPPSLDPPSRRPQARRDDHNKVRQQAHARLPWPRPVRRGHPGHARCHCGGRQQGDQRAGPAQSREEREVVGER